MNVSNGRAYASKTLRKTVLHRKSHEHCARCPNLIQTSFLPIMIYNVLIELLAEIVAACRVCANGSI